MSATVQRVKSYRVDALFDVLKGSSKYIGRYYREHPGEVPVYSATTDAQEVTGWVHAHDFDGEHLTWTTNGYAGRVFKRSGRFCATRDVGVLRVKPEFEGKLNLDFFAPILTLVFSDAAAGRRKDSGKADYTKLATKPAAAVEVSVPVDAEGLPDRAAQTLIAGRYGRIQRLRAQLDILSKQVVASELAYPSIQGASKEFSVGELFNVFKGDGSITKRYMRDNVGDVPVYTGSASKGEVAGRISRHMFDGDSLTWAADGYAGAVFYRAGPFAANSHCGILKAKTRYTATLHLPFFEFALTPILKAMAVGRFRSDGSPDYTRVGVGMARIALITLPIDEWGEPDKERQEVATRRMTRLRNAQSELAAEIERLLGVDVIVDGVQVD